MNPITAYFKSLIRIQNLNFDTMLNNYLFQKLKFIRNDKFNHLINILTNIDIVSLPLLDDE